MIFLPTMWGNPAIFLARLLALAALISQALMPGAMAAASTRPGDVPAFVCALPGTAPETGAQTLGADLAALLAEKSSRDLPGMDHDCGGCVLGQAATLPSMAAMAEPGVSPALVDAPNFEPRFAAVPRGPPLGPRAPPELMKA